MASQESKRSSREMLYEENLNMLFDRFRFYWRVPHDRKLRRPPGLRRLWLPWKNSGFSRKRQAILIWWLCCWPTIS